MDLHQLLLAESSEEAICEKLASVAISQREKLAASKSALDINKTVTDMVNSPQVKQLTDYLSGPQGKYILAGGGGALGGGLLGYMRGRKKNRGLQTALSGALAGGALGLSGAGIADMATDPTSGLFGSGKRVDVPNRPGLTMPKENKIPYEERTMEAEIFRDQPLKDRLGKKIMGQAGPGYTNDFFGQLGSTIAEIPGAALFTDPVGAGIGTSGLVAGNAAAHGLRQRSLGQQATRSAWNSVVPTTIKDLQSNISTMQDSANNAQLLKTIDKLLPNADKLTNQGVRDIISHARAGHLGPDMATFYGLQDLEKLTNESFGGRWRDALESTKSQIQKQMANANTLRQGQTLPDMQRLEKFLAKVQSRQGNQSVTRSPIYEYGTQYAPPKANPSWLRAGLTAPGRPLLSQPKQLRQAIVESLTPRSRFGTRNMDLNRGMRELSRLPGGGEVLAAIDAAKPKALQEAASAAKPFGRTKRLAGNAGLLLLLDVLSRQAGVRPESIRQHDFNAALGNIDSELGVQQK